MQRILFTGALAVVATLCACDSAHNYVTWGTGLHVKGTAAEESTARDYKDEGQGIFESKGTLASGTFAGEASGTRTAIAKTSTTEEWSVVADTFTENPLVPGTPTFSGVPVAIVEKVAVKSGTVETIETTVDERPQGARHVVETRVFQNVDRETTASTYGLAGDEYVVQISNLNLLWDPDLVEKWHATRTPIAGLDALVMADVAVGDFWVSPDGSTLYKGVARERVDVGGGKFVTAVKVEMRKVEAVDNDSLVGRCLVVPGDDDTTSNWTIEGNGTDGEGQTWSRIVHLDPGCQGQFAHYRVGFQWWSDNVLVAEDTTTFEVQINDFGYEWLDYQDGKVRRTAKALNPASIPGDAHLFVAYTYTQKHRIWRVEQMNTITTPWQQ
jgi:hypothetical protein